MEIEELVNKYGIIGVIGNYQSTLKKIGKVKDLPVKDIVKSLKMVDLDDSYLNYDLKDLTMSEFLKIELITKLEDDLIIIGNIYNTLTCKDREYIKKLLLKLSNDYNKKVVVIDNNVKTFFNLVKEIVILDNKKVIYETNDYYDESLYKYTNKPEIVDFINYVNDNNYKLNKTTDIYELIKDIYRSVS